MLVCDLGDGSCDIKFFKDTSLAQVLLECDDYSSLFSLNYSPIIINVQDDFNPPGGWSDEYITVE